MNQKFLMCVELTGIDGQHLLVVAEKICWIEETELSIKKEKKKCCLVTCVNSSYFVIETFEQIKKMLMGTAWDMEMERKSKLWE